MFFFSCSFLCHSLGHSNGIEWENSSNGIEGEPGLCFASFHSVAQKGETERQFVFYVFEFFLTYLVSITHPLFQVTVNMSNTRAAEDCSAGRTPRDESNACDESAEAANAASAEVRHIF